jgi:hypothetical protein
MFSREKIHLHEVKQGLQSLIFKHGPPVLQNMENGGKLNIIMPTLPNQYGIVKLL